MKTLLINIFLFLPALTYAQVKFTNLSSINPDSKELYFGVDNFLSFEGINYSVNKIRFSVSHGEISKVDGNKYLIRVGSEKRDTLNYYEDGKLILSEVFVIKRIPYEIVRLGNFLDTALTVGQILTNPFLTVILPGCSYKHESRIIAFSSFFIDSNGDTTSIFEQSGNVLTTDQLKKVKELIPNSRVYFSHIRATCPSCRIRSLPPLTIMIK